MKTIEATIITSAITGRPFIMGPDLEMPELDEMIAEEVLTGFPARVILYNDEEHTFDEVIVQLIKATGCSEQRAGQLAFEVDGRGLACVFEGEMTRCLNVSSVLEEISLHTNIEL